jgi:hypothetical protein
VTFLTIEALANKVKIAFITPTKKHKVNCLYN